jgi:hypothetical protein
MGSAVAVMEPGTPNPSGRINAPRVLIAGIAAGLVINASEFLLNQIVIVADMNTALARMNLPPAGGAAIPIFILLGFVGGISAVWLYAAIRPRFGAGPRTALAAGFFFWLIGYFWSGVVLLALHMFSARLMAISLCWELVESIAATLIGAALYAEK